MDNAVALAAIALAATTVAGLVWAMKYLANTLSTDLREHTKAALKQAEASREVVTFMRNLNGKLTKATIQTAKENE